MKRLYPVKYFATFTLPALVMISFTHTGWVTFLPLAEAFVVVPLLELFFAPDSRNITKDEEQELLKNTWFDWLVYLVVPVHLVMVGFFLWQMQSGPESLLTIMGRVSAMGLLCGVLGINVAHELGHRKNTWEQLMSKLLLLTSFYMHFFIEHNRGHHKNAATPEDPATARYNEPLYTFWVRSIIKSYLSAWKLEADRLRKIGSSSLTLKNEMLTFQLIQLLFISAIILFGGWALLLYYTMAAFMGILLLETVNYIEHYGLVREQREGRYQRVMPEHSWNSDHMVGRLMLFELSRHSDHHYQANRKYQILRHMEVSPQMPTGYPGMMILAFVPPLWFRIMNRRVVDFKKMLS
ncbi:alkane 1-monooxygenase [Marinoscillum furvescens DSM 4134]|uniref:Alkane 1-monooxygenase n=2 Tax=Marinoscillum furvescens TaxID=1026 RepID=A0A3D9L125_MARFU|nr:alkane 1-monooxygenase [Marinoscillum furvescens DSM 4134]